jgi:hypothetical protein
MKRKWATLSMALLDLSENFPMEVWQKRRKEKEKEKKGRRRMRKEMTQRESLRSMMIVSCV